VRSPTDETSAVVLHGGHLGADNCFGKNDDKNDENCGKNAEYHTGKNIDKNADNHAGKNAY
jgi:hypothetical protein